MEHMFFVCASRDEHSTWIHERCTSLWSMGTPISSSFEFRPFLWFAKIIPIALSLLVFYYCCVPFNFNKKRRLKENCTTSLRRIIIMRMLRGEGELRKTRLRPRVWEDSTLLWELQQHPHGLSRQAACKEHEWDLCVSVKFSLFWNMKQVFYAQRSSIVPSSIMVNTTNCTFKKISEINIPSLGAVQHVCMGGISHTSKILPTLLWASSLEQHDHHKHRRKFEMFRVYSVHACCVCSQSRSLLSFSFFREVSNSFSILSLLLYPPLCLLIFPRMSLFLYSFQ